MRRCTIFACKILAHFKFYKKLAFSLSRLQNVDHASKANRFFFLKAELEKVLKCALTLDMVKMHCMKKRQGQAIQK